MWNRANSSQPLPDRATPARTVTLFSSLSEPEGGAHAVGVGGLAEEW